MNGAVDTEARFRKLFDEAYPAVRRYAHHRGLSGADADDLVADVLGVAWRRLDDVPADDAIPWLLAVARNHWRNRVRAGRRRLELLHRLPAPGHSLPPGEPDDGPPGRLRAALASLRDDDQELLRLVAWDGLTPAQVAVVVGCSAGAARVRIHRARTRLAAALAAIPAPEEHTDART